MDALNFVPQVIKNCKDINEQLQEFSQSSKIDIANLCFDVLDIHTFIKSHQKEEYKIITSDEFAQLDKDNFYTKDNFFIQQTYDIRIRPKIKDYGLKLEVTPQADSMYLLFQDQFIIIDDDRFYEEIFGVVDSLMALNKIIFRQQDQQRQNLKLQFQEFLKQGDYPQKILLKTALDFIPYQPSRFEFILKQQWESNGKKAPENAFFGVGVEEVIAEYIKPIKGKSGRNLRGEYIRMDAIRPDQISPITHNKNYVSKEETPEKFIFKSLITGYVKILNDIITFNTDYEFDTMKTINSPTFLGGLESDITLTIKSDNELIDAVGSNMIIEASTINIIGSIGENVALRAKNISIEGQTHQSSIIHAQKAKITTHKGQFYGDFIEVKNFDSGFIQTDEADIGIASGSTIYAKKLKIKNLKSNNKINFYQECFIAEIQGGENKITISATSHEKTKDTMDFIDKKISLLKTKMHSMIKEYQLLMSRAKKNKPTVDKIKTADKQTQKAMLMDDDIKRTYQDFILNVKKLKLIKQELIKFQNNIKELNHNLIQIQDETLQAKITTQSEWKFENEIVYHRDYPKPGDEVLILQDGENVDISIDEQTKKILKQF
ncbi:flagellar assembly protein A [Helicobacter sp. 11S03491-1]|uniref:flagellar assembly protein A n=1 Tax=Helicobacter sp. 11S03491-1 TaxID=1476196 RepID=UPI000BA5F4C5|nr:flagellar assembly protein A [Helicobacter sp. 11S03491-1]PAF43440.1 hypothetical protein BKH45_02085 [Helicobacter sp. 11S03491-1]